MGTPTATSPPGPAAGGRAPKVPTSIIAGALTGSLLLVLAEFSTLFDVHVVTQSAPIKSVSTGSNNTYALVLIALIAAALAYGVARTGSRPALLAIGLLGLLALLIAVLNDLPAASQKGITRGFQLASNTAGPGVYLETLGAVLLLCSCVFGFMLLGAPARRARRASAQADSQP